MQRTNSRKNTLLPAVRHAAPVLVVVPSDHVAEILIAGRALERLGNEFPLRYLAAPGLSFPLPREAVTLALSSLASGIGRRMDLFFWFHALFRYFGATGTDVRSSLKVMSLRPASRLAHRIASLPVLASAVSMLDEHLVFSHDAAATRMLQQLKPALVLAPASALDSYSHLVLRSASRLGIPTAMLVTHWDYFSKKGLLRVRPDRIYVWGDEMRKLAVSCNGIDPGIIRIIGVPQFERYVAPIAPRRAAARARLRLPETGKVLLFAGTATPYDELGVLKRLDAVLARLGRKDARIIYRPHPRAWPRRRADNFDASSLPSVVLDPTIGDATTGAEHYLDLMAAVDGIVSPFSTMVLEGALCGRPSLCVSFDDGVNEWNFSEANDAEHIRALKGEIWLDVCTRSADLEARFESFLAKLEDPALLARIREEIRRTIHYDSESYGARLLRFLQEDFRLAPAVEQGVRE